MNKNSLITLFPSEIKGEITTPPSKSFSHRALICAALSKGKSVIKNVILSEDINATIDSLKHLGAKFEIDGTTITVHGKKRFKYSGEEVNCNESGSTIRFLIPIFSLTNKRVIFVGKDSLINRPFDVYKEIFIEDNNYFNQTIKQIEIEGSIKARKYYLPGNISSQFFSGLLFSLPLLEDDSYVYYTTTLESKSYIDLTIEMLKEFNIEIKEVKNGYFIRGNQTYKPTTYSVEGDYSQAAFHLVAGVINGHVKVNNLSHESSQGDKEIIEIIKRMKGKVVFTENGYTTEKTQTYGTTIDISNCPDLAPIVALLGSLSKGVTTIKNIERLRLKESDRVESTVCTLSKLGATIKVENNEIIIHGKTSLLGGVTVDSYNDHRIAMMVSVAATVCEQEISLLRPLAINKSYPTFFSDYKKIGGKYIVKD
jgi:3-phosphoshikimate 1-carboxyvinyltransferase